MGDAILEGVYYFGGVNFKGELSGKLKFLKASCSEGKVMSVEWQKLKQQGNPPAGRTGHTMAYLPVNQSLVIVGGRNDEVCRRLSIPFLNDMHLYLLDQKAWIEVKYIPSSEHLCRMGNHTMTVMSDGETYEKILIFGGITNGKKKHVSSLSN